MDTTTQEPLPAEEHRTPVVTEVEAIDPEHDIDAKKTVVWLGAGLAFVVVSLLVLAQTFHFAVQGQQFKVIDQLPTIELRQQRSDQDYLLKKQTPVGPADQRTLSEIDRSIEATTDTVIEAYLQK